MLTARPINLTKASENSSPSKCNACVCSFGGAEKHRGWNSIDVLICKKFSKGQRGVQRTPGARKVQVSGAAGRVGGV